jgi:enterochelin esterase-like enzyme
MSYRSALLHTLAAAVAAGILATVAVAQPAAPQPGGRGGGRGPAVVSPEVMSDGRVVFRIAAPKAQAVTLSAGDITVLFTGGGAGAIVGTNISTIMPATPLPQGWPEFNKSDNGIWEATVGPLPPGAYRYVFMVDGVRTLDPVNTRSAESNTNMWSLFTVPGADMMDTTDVPHGAVARITYYSTVLKTFRRMHIYTPPGYETANQKYPVFYLLHGAGDTDDAWISVGRANFIFDNLIAARKAKPMIVVMPAGHQPGTPGGGASHGGTPPETPAAAPAVNPFTNEFITDMLPYVEKHYRTINDRPHRAIAGLSMGGGQTLDIAFTHLNLFAQIGVFSSGASLGGGRGGRRGAPAPGDAAAGRGAPPAAAAGAPTAPPGQAAWERNHLADLDNASLKKGTKLIWFSTGKDDGLITNSKSTVEMLKKHGFDAIFIESAGAHSWFNWRNYLIEFTPQLFQTGPAALAPTKTSDAGGQKTGTRTQAQR